MNEIRFSESIEKTKEYIDKMKSLTIPLYRDRCDFCGDYGQGVYRVTDGRFICIGCMAKEYFESLVGKPDYSENL